MCGRYTLVEDYDLIADAFSVTREGSEGMFEPSYNLAPTQPAPIVGLRDGRRVLRVHQWGLIPSWATDARMAAQCINARSETVAEKPSFRTAFRKRRCLVPASGFYEWKREGKVRMPLYIHPVDGQVMAFAGLWEAWQDPAGGLRRTFTVITVPPNEVVAPIHDRMPAILPKSVWDAWLDPTSTPAQLLGLLSPAREIQLEAYPVDRRVGSPAANDPGLLTRIHAA